MLLCLFRWIGVRGIDDAVIITVVVIDAIIIIIPAILTIVEYAHW